MTKKEIAERLHQIILATAMIDCPDSEDLTGYSSIENIPEIVAEIMNEFVLKKRGERL